MTCDDAWSAPACRRALLAASDRARRRRRHGPSKIEVSAISRRSTGRCRSTSPPRRGWWEEVGSSRIPHLPCRRAAGRGGAGEVLGRRRHRLGAGGARRRALQPPHHRHHQRRVDGQRADGARGQIRRRSSKDPQADQGPEDPRSPPIRPATTRAALPEEVGPRPRRDVHDRQPGSGGDHLGHHHRQRRRRRRLGAEHLHARGEGGRQGTLLRRRRRRRSCPAR